MKKLLIAFLIVFCLKGYSQSDNLLYDRWNRDDTKRKFGVELNFKKNDSLEVTISDIPTTRYDYMYASFKIVKDTLFLHYADSTEVDKFEILQHDILKISYIKGRRVNIIDNQFFFREIPQ